MTLSMIKLQHIPFQIKKVSCQSCEQFRLCKTSKFNIAIWRRFREKNRLLIITLRLEILARSLSALIKILAWCKKTIADLTAFFWAAPTDCFWVWRKNKSGEILILWWDIFNGLICKEIQTQSHEFYHWIDLRK